MVIMGFLSNAKTCRGRFRQVPSGFEPYLVLNIDQSSRIQISEDLIDEQLFAEGEVNFVE